MVEPPGVYGKFMWTPIEHLPDAPDWACCNQFKGDDVTDRMEALPPLPAPHVNWPKPMPLVGGGSVSAAQYFTADQMHRYALAAIASAESLGVAPAAPGSTLRPTVFTSIPNASPLCRVNPAPNAEQPLCPTSQTYTVQIGGTSPKED